MKLESERQASVPWPEFSRSANREALRRDICLAFNLVANRNLIEKCQALPPHVFNSQTGVKMKILGALIAGSLFFLALSIVAQEKDMNGTFANLKQAEELGQVHWQRDFEKATQLAKESGKPLFVQFQEVPG